MSPIYFEKKLYASSKNITLDPLMITSTVKKTIMIKNSKYSVFII